MMQLQVVSNPLEEIDQEHINKNRLSQNQLKKKKEEESQRWGQKEIGRCEREDRAAVSSPSSETSCTRQARHRGKLALKLYLNSFHFGWFA